MEEPSDPDKNRLEYLQAKFILRFPFTITSMKWGVALGGFFGLHAFIKTRSFNKTAEWFFWGTVLTTFPIWCFFMVKHSFYSHTIRQFESEQMRNIQEAELMKIYIREKVGGSE
jgi:CDP-diglyceride synthetase